MLITFDTAPFDWRAKWWLVPLGHALVAVPFVVRALLSVLRSIPRDLRAAAATLGASPIRAWWQVDARALRRPLIAGAGFSAAISLGEFGATTILSRSGTETLPIAIGRLLGRAGALPQAQAFAMATILLVLSTVDRDGVGQPRASRFRRCLTSSMSRSASPIGPCSTGVAARRRRRDRRHSRALGRGQEHVAADHRRAAATRFRPRRARRRRHHQTDPHICATSE